jgi:hypothetical protein
LPETANAGVCEAFSRGKVEEVTGSLNERFIKTVGPHFVTLSCVQSFAGTPNEKLLLFSGFLVDVDGVWFYVTAGHILRDIRLALNAGARFDVWRLGDQTAGNRFNTGIPFDFDCDRWLVIEKEEIGIDYAVLALKTMYRDALRAGGAIPIDKNAWGNHVTEHDHWVLIGVPSESVLYDGKSNIRARLVVAPVESIDEPPVESGPKARNQFFARLKNDSASVLKDVDGMSGGPVFALKKVAGTWNYSVIGVQSGWYRSRRIIAACPFSSLGMALQDVVAEARLAVRENEGDAT